jgi:hypothetical protein
MSQFIQATPPPARTAAPSGDEDADAAFAGGGVVAVGGCDGPHDRGDDQHEHGDDEHERQERADDGAEVADAAEAVEVGEDAHRPVTLLSR